MTDKAIEAAVEAAREKRHELIAQPLERVYDQVVRAAIAAYEKTRWDEALGRYREVLDRQRNRPLPPPPVKEG